MSVFSFPEAELDRMAREVAAYMRQQRECYYPRGGPLAAAHVVPLESYVPPGFLSRVRVLELHGERIPDPPFYEEARRRFEKFPRFQHMSSLTFIDVVVFNDVISQRSLFHGLVHVVQFQVLGVDKYCSLFVRAFVRAGSHLQVPLEAQAYQLDARFAQSPRQGFSLEKEVRQWADEGRFL